MKKEEIIFGLASFISSQDIDEFMCKKINCNHSEDTEECVDCIIKFFSTPCKWLADNGVCVNGDCGECADFVSTEICSKCGLKEVS